MIKLTPIKKRIITYSLIIILSFIYLYFGHRYTATNLDIFNTDQGILSVRGEIVKIVKTESITNPYYEGTGIKAEPDKIIHFDCMVKSGEQKGEKIRGIQLIDGYMSKVKTPISEGDSVYLYRSTDGEYADEWIFHDFDRFGGIVGLSIFFFIALLIFGRTKGLNTIISLALTCASVIWVFIPAVLTGKNVYLWAILTCLFSITTTIIIVYDINKKSITAALGCFSGVIVAGIFSVIMDKLLHLSGMLNSESFYLVDLKIDIRAIIFAAIIIGSMGAIMDTGISIASSLWEVREKAESITSSDLIQSGFTIGKDMLGTMSNTLVLAYIGSSLSTILLLIVYSATPMELLNRESVIVEMLQSLIGIIAILATIPLTSAICGMIYGGKNEDMYLIVHKKEFEEE